jgi:arylsulfatase A-like enzyme
MPATGRLVRALLLRASCVALTAMLQASLLLGQSAQADERPNIVWIVVEDMSADFGCYGATAIQTPNVDGLARDGLRFTRAFVTAPICSISRSALITGCYQTSLGCQNHRSGTSRFPLHLPEGVAVIPQRMRAAGYHASNLTLDDFLKDKGPVRIAKTDYNFVWDASQTYETTHWQERPAGQPFFVQVQLQGGKRRGEAPGVEWPRVVTETLGSTTPPDSFQLPPYLPDDPVIRADWAQYLDSVRYVDWEVGRIVERLKAAGEWERTVVFLWTDHGISHVRNKQFLYDGGIHIPLVIRGPGFGGSALSSAATRDDLVEHIDIGATTLELAGIPRPAFMQGRSLLDRTPTPREFVFAARDRADETVDRIRSVRSLRYKYIRNYYPTRPYLQPNRYKDEKAIVIAMRRLYAEGKLDAAQSAIMAQQRPREELYDLEADPFELRNIADEPVHAAEKDRHRRALAEWIERTGDRGRWPEEEAVYRDYTITERNEGKGGDLGQRYRDTVEMMIRWTTERPMDQDP